MPDSTLSDAIKEAYATAGDVPIYPTLEFRHPAFSTPIRVVRDRNDLTAKLESDAPVNAGEYVTFLGYAFDFLKPEVSTTGVPQMTITIDNVSRLITAAIEESLASAEVVKVTYREYLANDLTGPQNDPPITADVISITADVFKITAVVGFPTLTNRRFPTLEYDADTFPGLVL